MTDDDLAKQPVIAHIRLAFAFDCPLCGKENFTNSVISEFSAKEQREAQEEFGEKLKTGDWVTYPTEVTCSYCHTEMSAINPDEVVDCP